MFRLEGVWFILCLTFDIKSGMIFDIRDLGWLTVAPNFISQDLLETLVCEGMVSPETGNAHVSEAWDADATQS